MSTKLEPKNNPKNPEHELYKKLNKIFSGPIVNYHTQGVRNFRRKQLDKYEKVFKDALGNKFQRSTQNSRIFKHISSEYLNAMDRAQRYADFDQMEFDPILASALDIYADEMTTHNQFKKMLHIKCSKDEIRDILHSLFYNVLNIEYNLYGWARNMVKLGDCFLYLDIDPETGIKRTVALPTVEVERLEGRDEENPDYVQFRWNSGGVVFENWQIAHFRILGNDKFAPLGTSVLEAARRVFRQLTLLEDAMMSYRIVRSSERRVFYLDVRGIPPEDREQYVKDVQKSMKQNQIVDPDTGKIDQRYNALSVEDDLFITVNGSDSGTRIDTLQAGANTSQIDDIKYIKDKLFAAIKIPQSYLIRGEGGEEEKGTLAQKDIRFSRTIQRLQNYIIEQLMKMAYIHLYVLGYRGEDLTCFELSLNNPSKLAEMQELENWKAKFDVAAAVPEQYTSEYWVATNILGLSAEDFLRNRLEKYHDFEYRKKLELEPGNENPGGGGSMDDLFNPATHEGGDMEDLPDMGGDGEEIAPGGEPSGPTSEEDDGNDGMILAAPGGAQGRRDDSMKLQSRDKRTTTTIASKGKLYTPAQFRGGDRRPQGANTRSHKSNAIPEIGHMPSRQTGLKLSLKESNRFSPHVGLLESLEKQLFSKQENTIYSEEENHLARIEKELSEG